MLLIESIPDSEKLKSEIISEKLLLLSSSLLLSTEKTEPWDSLGVLNWVFQDEKRLCNGVYSGQSKVYLRNYFWEIASSFPLSSEKRQNHENH